ncbi:YjjW family glycine radical enzyme activase [Marinifilum breve]|uniref:YjjW family glycine radical enzyme activase n=1 Tax=Marinifilum breve TaxID=2184082 RepID=A0A2V4A1U8_9BACT|nr:YjjW family glycine radical enzyme activase [Marinifilum breve]PXY02588.1 YjjW family glycine radical enzyme activase [Marinifilum breve]
MSKLQANISGIIKSSVIDGPGNRMVIFFQECNLNCMYCHNSHTIGLCNLCGTCVHTCPSNSLKIDSKNKRIIHNENSCTRCDECLKVCPENSSPFYKQMSVEDIISEILEGKDFISGITVSGGEVMLHAPFLSLLFQEIRSNSELKHLSILIDSNGNIDQEKWNSLLPYIDGVMLDIKAYSANTHKKITGYSNEKILKSIHYLDNKSKLKELRFVLVPDYNNHEMEIREIAKLMKSVSPSVQKSLIKMRKHGIRKEFAHLIEPREEEIEYAKNIFSQAKLDILVI